MNLRFLGPNVAAYARFCGAEGWSTAFSVGGNIAGYSRQVCFSEFIATRNWLEPALPVRVFTYGLAAFVDGLAAGGMQKPIAAWHFHARAQMAEVFGASGS